MQYYIATVTGQYFTAGKLYSVLDYVEGGGILTMDDDNKDHYLSGEYLLRYFRKASDAQIRLLQKAGRL